MISTFGLSDWDGPAVFLFLPRHVLGVCMYTVIAPLAHWSGKSRNTKQNKTKDRSMRKWLKLHATCIHYFLTGTFDLSSPTGWRVVHDPKSRVESIEFNSGTRSPNNFHSVQISIDWQCKIGAGVTPCTVYTPLRDDFATKSRLAQFSVGLVLSLGFFYCPLTVFFDPGGSALARYPKWRWYLNLRHTLWLSHLFPVWLCPRVKRKRYY